MLSSKADLYFDALPCGGVTFFFLLVSFSLFYVIFPKEKICLRAGLYCKNNFKISCVLLTLTEDKTEVSVKAVLRD